MPITVHQSPQQRAPSFGQRLSQGIGRGLEAGSQLLQQNQQQQQMQQAAQQLGIDPSVLTLPKEAQAAYFKEHFSKQEGENPLQQANTKLAEARKRHVEEQTSQLQGKKKKEEEGEKHRKNLLDTTFNRLEELTSSLGRGTGIYSLWGGETANKSAEFTSLTGVLESELVERVNKGTLSNTRFNYIKDTLLPNPSDSEATIRGKLKAIKSMLSTPDSESSGIENQEIPEFMNQKKPPLSSFHR